MEYAPRYWLGLLMFGLAAIFTAALGSLIQYRAIAQHQAAIAAYDEEPLTASLPPPSAPSRKMSSY